MAEQPQPQTQAPAEAPTEPPTVAVKYVGEDSFIYGDRLIAPGDMVDLPAEEVEAWGTDVPPAFQKEG